MGDARAALASRLLSVGHAHRHASHADSELSYRQAAQAESANRAAQEAQARVPLAAAALRAAPPQQARDAQQEAVARTVGARQAAEARERETARRAAIQAERSRRSAAQAASLHQAAQQRASLLAGGGLHGARPADADPKRGTPCGGPRDRKSTRLNSSHLHLSRMPSSA